MWKIPKNGLPSRRISIPLIFVLKDSAGKVVDVASTRTGFRKLEIRNGCFLLNGCAVKMKGVCRVETDPFGAKYVTRERVLQEVLLMKRNNINTVRTAHMPAWSGSMTIATSTG